MEAGAPLLLYQESIASRASVLHAPLHERGRDTERVMERGPGQGESRLGLALGYSQGGEGWALSLSWPVRDRTDTLTRGVGGLEEERGC